MSSPRALLWPLLLTAFAVIGAIHLARNTVLRALPAGPDAGFDAAAAQHFDLAEGAAVIRQATRDLPLEGSVLVIGPGRDWTTSDALCLISSLTWPRSVWSVPAEGGASPFTYPPPPGVQPAALFFYAVQPPSELADRTRVLSPRLALVRLAP